MLVGGIPPALAEPAKGADETRPPSGGGSGTCGQRIEELKQALHLRGPMKQDGRTVWKIRDSDGKTTTLTESDMSGPVDTWFEADPLPYKKAYADVMAAIRANQRGDEEGCNASVHAARQVLREARETESPPEPG